MDFFFSVKKSKSLGINAIDIGLCSVVQHQAQSAHLSQVLREDSHFFLQTKCFKTEARVTQKRFVLHCLSPPLWVYRSACLA